MRLGLYESIFCVFLCTNKLAVSRKENSFFAGSYKLSYFFQLQHHEGMTGLSWMGNAITLKSENELRTMTSKWNIRHMVLMPLRTVQLHLDSWMYDSQLQKVYHCLHCQFVDVCCTVSCLQSLYYTGSPSNKTIYVCSCNVLMNIETSNMFFTCRSPFKYIISS